MINPTTACAMPVLTRLLVVCALVFPGLAFSTKGVQAQGSAQAIAEAINQARAANGLPGLAVHPLLDQAAQVQANDIMANYNYSHRGSDGSSVQVRVARTGYSAKPWVSENWVSSRSADGAMRWWMNDYIHRVNILNRNWTEVGIGVAARASNGEMIFVTVFSAGGGATAGEAPPPPDPVIAASPQPVDAPAPVRVQVPAEGMDYSIRAGDTLLGIAIRHGTDWETLAEANGLTERSLLQIGQVLRVPGSGAFAEAAAMLNASVLQIETEEYAIKSGDTLFGIAARHGITWQELAALNKFSERDYLQIDQVIQVPKQKAPAESNVPALEASAREESGDTPDVVAVPASASGLTPVVAPVVTEPLVLVNPAMAKGPIVALSSDMATSVQAAAVQELGKIYTVAAGDTIFGIALKHKVDWQELLSLNGLSESSILQLGQQIQLP
jgi:LysM repeat protein/uncharacterized protein YkwD